MRKIAFMGILWVLNAAGTTYAYGPCDEDEAKLCDTHSHAETVKACLHKNVDRLSADCKAFVKAKDAEWQKTVKSWDLVKTACASDTEKHCKEATKQEQMKALQVCLMAEAKALTSACKQDLNRHIREFQPSIKALP